MVRAVPLNSGDENWDTIAENWGESDTTVNPQIKIYARNIGRGQVKINAENRQQKPEIYKLVLAILLDPQREERYPPATHEIPPEAITRKLKSGIFKPVVFFSAYRAMMTGINPQNVYSSHIWPK